VVQEAKNGIWTRILRGSEVKVGSKPAPFVNQTQRVRHPATGSRALRETLKLISQMRAAEDRNSSKAEADVFPAFFGTTEVAPS
jgi:hypothetical protein